MKLPLKPPPPPKKGRPNKKKGPVNLLTDAELLAHIRDLVLQLAPEPLLPRIRNCTNPELIAWVGTALEIAVKEKAERMDALAELVCHNLQPIVDQLVSAGKLAPGTQVVRVGDGLTVGIAKPMFSAQAMPEA